MKTITLEEHFATPGFFDGPGRELKNRAETVGGRYANLIERLCDIGAKRLAEMDAAGIDMQVVSLTSPGVEQLEAAEAIALARDTNDYLADAVKKNPARFAGLAAVPTPAPDKAAAELEAACARASRARSSTATIAGAISTINSIGPSSNARRRSTSRSICIRRRRPRRCSTPITAASRRCSTEMLAGGAWGWHIETAVHVIRLISGGVFDRFPQLQIVIGHMGEGLPFMFQRFDIMPPGGDQAEAIDTRSICARTCTTPFRASTSRRPSSICSSNSAASSG